MVRGWRERLNDVDRVYSAVSWFFWGKEFVDSMVWIEWGGPVLRYSSNVGVWLEGQMLNTKVYKRCNFPC